MNLHFRESKGRTANRIVVLALLIAGSIPGSHAEDILWTYDFANSDLTDWNHNSNSPSAGIAPGGNGTVALYNGGNTVFHSAAVNETQFQTEIGDRIQMRLAWTPFETRDAVASSNNQVFQIGLMNLDTSWEKTESTFNTADGFWLSGREVSSVAPWDGTWGSETLNLFLHSDETPSLLSGAYLGQITFDSYLENGDGSVSATYLDIGLNLESTNAGNFNYGIGIDSYEWTLDGGTSSFVKEGTIFKAEGTRAHGLDGFDELHPAIGYLVSDSSQQGAAASFFASSSSLSPIPEPSNAGLFLVGVGLLMFRRSR